MARLARAGAPALLPCPNCAHAVRLPAYVCPNCFGRLEARCEDCGRSLVVRPRRVRAGGAVRLALEVAGVLVFVFTFGSILGPVAGLALVGVAQLFGYKSIPHYYCPVCRRHHHGRSGVTRPLAPPPVPRDVSPLGH